MREMGIGCWLAVLLAVTGLGFPAKGTAQETTVAASDTVEPSAGDTLTGQIPDPDPLYTQLIGSRDTLRPPGPQGGAIEYQGQRVVFYPEGEVIVLEGQAAAEQAGTRLQARRILFRSREGVVEAFQEASVQRGPSELRADSLFYDREHQAVATFGASILSEGGSQTEGLDLRYDLDRRSGRLGAGITTYAPWILEGADMAKIGQSTYVVEEGHFTTCDLEPFPHYKFVSEEIKLRQDDVIVAAPVVLYFSDIPVFYLPWYVEPVERGRHTGVLRPQIGINTLLFNSGQERNVQDLGFYYVFNEYADALIAADLYTESRFIMRLDTRYHVRYEFQGDLHYESVWNRLDDSRSQLVRYRHDHTFSPETRANVDLNWSDERSFLRRNSFDPEEILQRAFRSAASYSTRFDWGSLVAGADADFRLDVDRTDYNLADVSLSINQRPLWGRRAAAGANQSWFQNLQYSANTSFNSRLSRSAVDSLGNPLTRIPTDSLGRELDVTIETIENEQEGRGQFTLSGPLTLLGVLKANPSISYNASLINDELATEEKVGGRGQLGSGINLSTRFFRIFEDPVGPFTRMRHTVSPNVSISYSPKANLFGAENTEEARDRLRETLTASISLGQDIDVRRPVQDRDDVAESMADSVAQEEATDEEEQDQGQTLNLLNITNTLSVDVLRQLRKDSLGFGNLNTRITTGLGRDFNVSTTFEHQLVKQGEARQIFDPFLTRITTDFSIRKGGAIHVGTRRDRAVGDRNVLAGRGADQTTEEAKEKLAEAQAEPARGFGPWSLNLTHSWTRDRSGDANRQSLGIGLSLLPSAHWSLDYRTTYDVTEGELQAQTLALVRNLHDWQATLGMNIFPADPQDRVLVSFSVYLREVPDLQVPYRVRRE